MYESPDETIWSHHRRHRLDRALSGPAFRVDQLACNAAAAVISECLDIKAPTTAVTVIEVDELLLSLCLAAICHQMNWDFLSAVLRERFENERIDAAYLSRITSAALTSWLIDYPKKERIRAPERAALLRDLGDVLTSNFDGDAANLLMGCSHRISGKGGLMASLDRFRAFNEDPLRKKSNIIVHELVRNGLWQFADEHEVQPAIDYHIMRLHLRTGRVVPLQSEVSLMLQSESKPRLRLITLLRRAVSDSLAMTAFYANLSIPVVNTFEWELGRSICDRNDPKCVSYTEHTSCPNEGFCQAFINRQFLSFKEPDTNKSFY